MPIITIRIEDDLRNNASSVLDALGLDIPTAVRMYLKESDLHNRIVPCRIERRFRDGVLASRA